MTEEQLQAVTALDEGLRHFDRYGGLSDDEPLFACTNDCLYELATEDDRLKIKHLRTLLTIFRGI